MSNTYYENERPNPGKSKKLQELLLKSDNRLCADCCAPDPKWASANIGVFLCTKCGSAHSRLGTPISKVMSVALDKWADEEIDSMIQVGGNSIANSIYEAFLPKEFAKPNQESSNEERDKFIRSKYELQEFLKPNLRIVSSKSFKACNSMKSMPSKYNSDGLSTPAPMMKFMGTVKVKVMRGINLAVRDLRTSDPYVVLTLGQQRAQTTVIHSNLNPVWNQELIFTVPKKYGALKLHVYDYDTFSADDIMGEAEVDLQPMVEAASSFGDIVQLRNMQIGRWLKTCDNALTKDSIVLIDNGKVKQEVSLKLQNVESGELELELEWLPIDQLT